MANPFLFDAPTGAPPADNPFLAGAAAPVDNPFLQSAAPPQPTMAAAAPQMMAPQAQYGMFGQPQMMQQTMMHTPPVMAAQVPQAVAPAAVPVSAAAANPFADFAAPAPVPPTSGAAMFGAPAAAAAPVAPVPPPAAVPIPEPEPIREKVADPPLPPAPPVEEAAPPAPVDNPFLQSEAKEEEAPPPPAKVESPVKPSLETEKTDAAEDVPLPPPPPPEESSPVKEEELPPPPPTTQEVEPEPQQMVGGEDEPAVDETPVASSDVPIVDPTSPQAEEPSGPSQGASLFGLPAEPELKTEAEEDEELDEGFRTKMTTGDAIFSDLPAAGPASTGANLFGTSEESAAGSTGASIFDVAAPRAALPQLGEMSGWDDDFDAKFNEASAGGGAGGFANASAAPIFPGDPTDPFAGTGAGLMPGASASGFGTGDFNPSAKPTSFGDEANPFAAEAAAASKQEGEGDSPLFDDDTSKPLEPFPRINIQPDGWEFFIRHPPKKKLTAQR